MSYERLPYADAETFQAMSTDCLEAGSNLSLPGQRATDREVPAGGPSFLAAVRVPDSAARLAGDLQLHLD